jgi:hypothetical protein
MMNDNDIQVRRWLTTARRKMNLSRTKTHLSAATWLQVVASSQGDVVSQSELNIRQIVAEYLCLARVGERTHLAAIAKDAKPTHDPLPQRATCSRRTQVRRGTQIPWLNQAWPLPMLALVLVVSWTGIDLDVCYSDSQNIAKIRAYKAKLLCLAGGPRTLQWLPRGTEEQ